MKKERQNKKNLEYQRVSHPNSQSQEMANSAVHKYAETINKESSQFSRGIRSWNKLHLPYASRDETA